MPADRRSRIVEQIGEFGVARVEQLAAELGVSVATIRRDLQHLDSHGILSRVHGGAVVTGDTSFSRRERTRVVEKGRIAAAAARLVKPGDAIALDTGTTVLAVTPHLQVQGLSIVTNSVDVLVATRGLAGVRLVLTGGTFDPGSHSMYGNLTERFYAEHHVDKVFIGAGSASAEGLRDSNIDALAAKRAAIRAATEVIALVDSSKFRMNALGFLCDWGAITTLVTDTEAPEAIVEDIRRAGVQVVEA